MQALRDGTPLRQSLEGVEARKVIVAPTNVVAQETVAGAKPVQLCPTESDERLERSNCGAHLGSEKHRTGYESSENAQQSDDSAGDIVDDNHHAYEYRGEKQ